MTDHRQCPLLEAKPTSRTPFLTSVIDPFRTCAEYERGVLAAISHYLFPLSGIAQGVYQIGLVYAPAGCSAWFESTGLSTDPVRMPDPHDSNQHERYRNIRPQVRVLIWIKESLRNHYQTVQQIGENAPVE